MVVGESALIVYEVSSFTRAITRMLNENLVLLLFISFIFSFLLHFKIIIYVYHILRAIYITEICTLLFLCIFFLFNDIK